MGTFQQQRVRGAFLLCALVASGAAGWPREARGVVRPTTDLRERFLADPRESPAWHASGTWSWDAAGTAVVSGGPGTGEFLWTGGSHYAGAISARLKLIAGREGRPPAARLTFAVDPATGGHRWFEVSAGRPGRLVLGQSGAVRGSPERVLQIWRANVPEGVWLEVGLRLAGTKGVTASLGAATLFTAAAAPLAPGLVGFASRSSTVAFDEFTFAADPDGEPCVECHAGQPGFPLAANVYAYWDGRWWDTFRGGNASTQQGGHGDPAGRPATACVGTRGCHDLRLPAPSEHRNGVREGRPQRGAQRSVNPYHLRAGFLVAQPRQPWEAQVAFDNYCYAACHRGYSIRDMRHERDTLPGAANYRSVEMGTHLTDPDAESRGIYADSDLTSRATPTEPDYVPCVACHDPHGTAAPAPVKNKMLRNRETDPYWCAGINGCHV